MSILTSTGDKITLMKLGTTSENTLTIKGHETT